MPPRCACHHEENTNLKRISKDFERQLTKLHETIGAVGDQRDGMLDRLEGLCNQQKIESDRQRTENDRHDLSTRWHAAIFPVSWSRRSIQLAPGQGSFDWRRLSGS